MQGSQLKAKANKERKEKSYFRVKENQSMSGNYILLQM